MGFRTSIHHVMISKPEKVPRTKHAPKVLEGKAVWGLKKRHARSTKRKVAQVLKTVTKYPPLLDREECEGKVS